MRRMTTTAVLLLAAGAAVHVQAPKGGAQTSEAQTKTLNLSAYAELLRSDIRTQKVAIITEVMRFSEAEDTAFWPAYRECEADMAKLGDERVALIAEYADNYSKITDEIAEKLAAKAIDLEARRHAAKAKCFERVKAVLPARTALRFLQVEHQLQLLIDLQISAALPIVDSEQMKEARR